jgi:hypothetical protein
MYGLTRPMLDRFGGFSRYLKFILGAWAYCVVLVFFIIPVLRPADRIPLSDPAGWAISVVMGIVFGLALGAQSVDETSRTPRRRLSKRAIVMMWCVVAMCQVGWVGLRWAGQWPAAVGFGVVFGSLFIGLLITVSWFSASNGSSGRQSAPQLKPPQPGS